jgi:hypothetical protein
MGHDKKKQSTGSWKGNRDQHQKKEPKGPRESKGYGQGESYKPPKFRDK